MIRLPFLTLLIAGCLLPQSSPGEAPTSVYNGCGFPSLGAYEPRKPKSLDEFPAPIRAAVEKHLLDRLGDTFRKTLEYSGGQIVDMDELHRGNPSSIGYRWEVPAYQLCFLVKQPRKEIEYHAYLQLRKDGIILKEVNLPAVAKHPERGTFVSLKEALAAAAGAGLKPEDTEVRMAYLDHAGIVVFEFSQYIGKTDSTHHIKRARVDAHTGKFIDLADLTADG